MPRLNNHRLTLMVTFVALLLNAPLFFGAGGQAVSTCLLLDREAVARGEAWRLVTGHLVHFSPQHLFLDLAVFTALGLACEAKMGRRYPILLAGSALVVGGAVLLLEPGLRVYGGLSGVDSALFVAVVTLVATSPDLPRRGRAAVAGLSSLLFAGKVVFEMRTGGAFFSSTLSSLGVRAVPAAHVAGAAAGLAVALLPDFLSSKGTISWRSVSRGWLRLWGSAR